MGIKHRDDVGIVRDYEVRARLRLEVFSRSGVVGRWSAFWKWKVLRFVNILG